ncbi:hypothetical protein [Methanocella paludicola]|nr:hypothetical protein [Methanocella paludicola]
MIADRVASTLVENTLAYRVVETDTILTSIIDIDKFDNTYKTDPPTLLYSEVGLDNQKYCIEIDIEQLKVDNTIHVTDSIIDTTHPLGNQNVGQSRRFVIIRSPDENNGWTDTKAVIVVRIWQWAY